MIKKAIGLAAVLAAALTVTMSAGAVPCCLTNGSFESNNLNGWSTSLTDGDAFTFAGGVPGGGSFAARVDTLDSGAGVWQGLSQTRFGPAGKISGWARYGSTDLSDCPTFNDEAQVLIDGHVVFSASSCGTGPTGWVKFSSFVATGTHTVTAQVRNDGDSSFSSNVDLDAVVWDVRAGWPSP